MKKFLPFLVLSGLTVFSSCVYEPHQVYNRPVNQHTNPPDVQILELSIETDTLVIYGNTPVNFRFQSDNQQIETVELFADGKLIGTVYGDNGTFMVLADELSPGLHDLEMQVFTGSGSGSIAEALGAEGYLGSNTWKLVVYHNYDPEIVSFVENGLLHIRWNPFLASNFQDVVIRKSLGMVTPVEIFRSTDNEFIDSSYVGETANYNIDFYTKGDEIYMNGFLQCAADLPVLAFSVNAQNHYLLTWTRPHYFAAIDSIIIGQGSQYDYNASDEAGAVHQMSDTTFRITSGSFADEMNFKIRLVPKKTNVVNVASNAYFFESHTWGRLGFPFKVTDYTPYCFPVDGDAFVYYDCDYLSRYSLTERKTVERLSYPSTGCSTCSFVESRGSNTGRYISSYVDCNRDVLLVSGNSLHSKTVYHLQSITYGGYPPTAISDSGTGILFDYNGGLNLYDFRNSSLSGHYKVNILGDVPKAVKITPDGRYFLLEADTMRLVKFDQGIFIDIWKVTGQNISKYAEFDATRNDRIVLWNGNTVAVRKCEDMSLIRSFPLNDALILDFDYVQEEMLTYVPGHLYVRSYADGSLIHDVPIGFDPSNWVNACYLIDHTIVYGQGLLYFLE